LRKEKLAVGNECRVVTVFKPKSHSDHEARGCPQFQYISWGGQERRRRGCFQAQEGCGGEKKKKERESEGRVGGKKEGGRCIKVKFFIRPKHRLLNNGNSRGGRGGKKGVRVDGSELGLGKKRMTVNMWLGPKEVAEESWVRGVGSIPSFSEKKTSGDCGGDKAERIKLCKEKNCGKKEGKKKGKIGFWVSEGKLEPLIIFHKTRQG